MWYVGSEENMDYISHHGILGQKWGIRRYQYEDGSLTPEGRIRYGTQENYERAVRKHDRNVRIAKGVAIGALAGLAVYGGARYLKKQRMLKAQMTAGLSKEYLTKTLPEYQQYAKGFTYEQLTKIKKNMVDDAKAVGFTNPKHKAVYDAVNSEIIRRDTMAKVFEDKGKETITDLITTARDKTTNEFAKGLGTSLGAAAVGALVATAKQATEQRDRSPEDKANEYANYMWQNPNKK